MDMRGDKEFTLPVTVNTVQTVQEIFINMYANIAYKNKKNQYKNKKSWRVSDLLWNDVMGNPYP